MSGTTVTPGLDGSSRRLLPAGGLLVAALVGLTGVNLLMGGGGIGLAVAPICAFLLVYGLWRLPLRYILYTVLLLGLCSDPPGDNPNGGHWKSPVYYLGSYLLENLNTAVGPLGVQLGAFHVAIPTGVLKFSAFDILTCVLATIAFLRAIAGEKIDGKRPQVNTLQLMFFALAFLTILWLEAWGIARGGNMKASLWQFRQLLWLPISAATWAYAMRGPRDFAPFARIVVFAACFKVAIGAYFNFVVAPTMPDVKVSYVTTHGDTVLFVSAVAFSLASLLYKPSLKYVVLNLTSTLWILFGIVINNRRLAFVSLFGSCIVIYSLLTGRIKKLITMGAIAAMPFFLAYVVVGANRSGAVWGPANDIASVVTQDDASSETRDIENYNLIFTLRTAPTFGTGFGHEYIEISVAYDISEVMPMYRYIGHNSVLWLWSISGIVGWTMFWMMFVISGFLAARGYHFARNQSDKLVAVAVLGVIVTYSMQAWGDMGMQSWTATLITAPALALAGKLATATGAWPEGVRLFARRKPVARRAPVRPPLPQPAGAFATDNPNHFGRALG
jgi:hypothetical protein